MNTRFSRSIPKATTPAAPAAACAASTGPLGRGVRRPCGQLMSSTPNRRPHVGFPLIHIRGQSSWRSDGNAPLPPLPRSSSAFLVRACICALQLGSPRIPSPRSPCCELAHSPTSHSRGDQRLYRAEGRSFSSLYERLKYLVVVTLRWVVHNLAG